jgi:uncharacterized heparinase superfamily protein
MVQFFLDAGGVLAHFNGATPVSGSLIDAILSQGDATGRAHGNASHSGYQRLDGAGTSVIMDCGTPPPVGYAGQAHAGALAFELTSATNRIVINCGTSPAAGPQWRTAARETAAHSTIVIDGLSSARPIETGVIAHMVGPTLFGGPRDVRVDRREHGGATAIVASHDGYAARKNLIHERTLRLSATGDRIDGRDLLMPATDQPMTEVGYLARFHLDPAIEPVLLNNGVVMLMFEDSEAWEFHADGIRPALEDSVYLADPVGPKPTRQIVLAGILPETVELRWTFVRTRGPAMTKRS